MKRLSNRIYNREALQRLVRSVTFFKDIVKLDQDQFELLLSVSEFVEAPAGDTLLRKDDEAHTLYFLLKGQVTVLSEDEKSLNIISPGEVFGALSMVTGRGRSATVKSSTDVVLLGIDFKYFQQVDDFSMFSMGTKLVAYRMVVHNIRWTLEVNKMKSPNHSLVLKLSKAPLYAGVRGGEEELESLYEQSRVLADLLCEWNDSMD
jgi:CRP/FNR family cyclic AMP-dependent transcriptional regulator